MKFVRWLGAFRKTTDLSEATAWEISQTARQIAAEPLHRGRSLVAAQIGLEVDHVASRFHCGWLEDAWTEVQADGTLRAKYLPRSRQGRKYREIKMNFAFITRHAPTTEQVALASEQGITLHVVGDADAFTVGNSFVHEAGNRLNVVFEGVVVVHPAAALRLCSEFLVGVFENANRAAVGDRPQFEAVALHVYDMRE